MIIPVKTSSGGYEIILQRGALKSVDEYLDLKRKVLVITDSGVPREYSETVATLCEKAVIFTFEQGEGSKNIDTYKGILEALIENGFTRTDCIVAVGGGVTGDMAGFAAATFMRGIDFYNIPTTLLSQVDSSIGGKTAIDFMGIKNIVGAFYPPKCVIIDPDTLSTLPQRHISNGLAEAVKMAVTFDKELFEFIEREDVSDVSIIDEIIYHSLMIKKRVVEEDEKESGLRKVLNFGHTLGHGIESINVDTLIHGECVALGMIPMCDAIVADRLVRVLEKLNLPTSFSGDTDSILSAVSHDKKKSGDFFTAVYVCEIGSFEFKKFSLEELSSALKNTFKKED